MIEKGIKHVTNVRETVYADCIQFLEHCESMFINQCNGLI